MLIQLDIENIAVIERASIEFENGLNIITGETGAGKSLLINSLNMVLGSRTAKDMISKDSDFAKVSAVFFSNEISAFLEENSIPIDEGTVIITRKLYRDGRNICHINSVPVNVSTLRSVGKKMVVIHGQNDSLELSDTSSHIHFLDAFCKNDTLLEEYKVLFKELKETKAMLDKLNDDALSRQNEIDYLTYQTDEIEKASLSESEEEELIARRNLLLNSEELSTRSQKAYFSLSGENGAKDILYTVKRELEKLSSIDPLSQDFADRANDLYYEIDSLCSDVSSYMSKIEFSPSELSEISDRLDLINTLKRKYNGEISDILSFYEEASKKLSLLLSYDENKAVLQDKYEKLFSEATSVAKKLSSSRKESAAILSDLLKKELESLDMPSCLIEFSFTPTPLSQTGLETVELLISTNPKDSPKALSKIASGGEISRIMLAIKSVFSDFDKVPTLLFDEIDTGVSGRAAEKIAKKMRLLSKKYQLITVTHLPVIASFADNHLLIEKKLCDSSFKTNVKQLTEEERIREVARIISGDSINEVSLQNAAQMLENAKI